MPSRDSAPAAHVAARADAHNQKADWDACGVACEAFVAKVLKAGAAHYRDLPWRNIDDPYAVLVSEVMLQQTQVARVEDFWRRFLAAFPTIDALAAASPADVLALWQGLGYNRRALALKRCADECSARYAGQLPQSVDELKALPGIGPATAAGVVAFARNEPSCYIETNVRTVFLHELFPEREKVTDRELSPYVQDAAACAFEGATPRTWYYALLDYGAYLKSQVTNPSRRSAHYSRQSAFEGSHRQKRSFVLKFVLAAPEGAGREEAHAALDSFEARAGRAPVPQGEFDAVVSELCAEGFFKAEGDLLRA